MGCAPTSSGDRPPRPLRDLADHARAAGRGIAYAGRVLARRVPFWRLYGRFLETGPGQAFLDRGKILGAGAARLVVPAVDADIPWAPLAGPLREARVALVSTGGFYLPPDLPFDVDAALGDPSLRVIPSGTPLSDLRIAHAHYGHQRADRDRNVVFPLDRLRELAAAGFIGGIGPRAYSFGFTVHTGELVDPTGSAHGLARLLAEDGVDAVLFAPA